VVVIGASDVDVGAFVFYVVVGSCVVDANRLIR
jgi:hypothetical protein